MSATLPSRVPAVTDWLMTNLPIATGLDPTYVVDGPPTEANLRTTCIIIGDVDMDQEWAALGARNRNEEAILHLVIYHIGQGGQTVVNNVAWDLLASIETYMRVSANVTAGNNVLWMGVVPTTLTKELTDNARAAWLEVDLKFTARI